MSSCNKSLKRIKKECDIFQHLLCLSTAIFEPYEQLQSMHQVERKRMWVEACCLQPRTAQPVYLNYFFDLFHHMFDFHHGRWKEVMRKKFRAISLTEKVFNFRHFRVGF